MEDWATSCWTLNSFKTTFHFQRIFSWDKNRRSLLRLTVRWVMHLMAPDVMMSHMKMKYLSDLWCSQTATLCLLTGLNGAFLSSRPSGGRGHHNNLHILACQSQRMTSTTAIAATHHIMLWPLTQKLLILKPWAAQKDTKRCKKCRCEQVYCLLKQAKKSCSGIRRHQFPQNDFHQLYSCWGQHHVS